MIPTRRHEQLNRVPGMKTPLLDKEGPGEVGEAQKKGAGPGTAVSPLSVRIALLASIRKTTVLPEGGITTGNCFPPGNREILTIAFSILIIGGPPSLFRYFYRFF